MIKTLILTKHQINTSMNQNKCLTKVNHFVMNINNLALNVKFITLK